MEKCGIYKITCSENGQIYVGSSKQIYKRWGQHRRDLRQGVSNCRYLQNAWSKYGEDTFYFSVIEECAPEILEEREQWHIDGLKPKFNSITDVKRRFGKEQREKIAAAVRARAASITHCPRGHLYDEANTYIGKNGGKRCRACNAARISARYCALAPEDREAHIQSMRENHRRNRADRLAKQREYVLAHKEEKAEYDRRNRVRQTKLQRSRIKNETPEQRDHRLAQKRASYHRCKEPTTWPPSQATRAG